MALWINWKPQSLAVSFFSTAWDQIIIICWLLFATNQISLKNWTDLVSGAGGSSGKVGTKVDTSRPKWHEQILNQASPEFPWSVGEVLLFLQSKGTLALASTAFSPGFYFWTVFKLWVCQKLSGREEPIGQQTCRLSQPQLPSTPPLYPEGHGWRGMVTAKERILFHHSKPSVTNPWPAVRHDSGGVV